MTSQIDILRREALLALNQIKNGEDLEQFRLHYLTKKGPLQTLLRELGDMPIEERKSMGARVNTLRDELEKAFEEAKTTVSEQVLANSLASDTVDVSLPGRTTFHGGYHPVMQAMDRMLNVLIGMGFSIHYGPNVDDDYHNFESLNFPANHPARDMQDTFYLDAKRLLRTQTSNAQVRLMKELDLPIRVAVPGRCFRNETLTARSHVMFHQVEGIYIDKNVSLADLLATLECFYKALFKSDVKIRVRPSYFPFVEPGVEVDVSCVMCSGHGCSTCKHSGWLELAGAGMVHPNVLREGGIDPTVYSGFAWGMGVDRLVMTLLGIDDIRLFTQNDMRFLKQFRSMR